MLNGLIADQLGQDDEPESVAVGIETDRGPWVQALIATGYTVYALHPMQVARYLERHVGHLSNVALIPRGWGRAANR